MSEFALQAKQFRAKAAICFARSKDLQDPEYQRIFYDLAIEWLAMAAEADSNKEARRNTLEGKSICRQLDPLRKYVLSGGPKLLDGTDESMVFLVM